VASFKQQFNLRKVKIMQDLINKIHLASCFDILKLIPDESVDLILTDPPYLTTNLDYDKKAAKSLDFNLWKSEIIRIAKPNAPILIFSSGKFTYFMVNLMKEIFRYELIWDKVNKTTGFVNANLRPMLNHEFVLYFSKSFIHPSRMSKSGLRANTYNHGVLKLKESIVSTAKESKSTLYGVKAKIDYKKLNDAKYPRSILRFNKSSSKGIHPSAKPLPLISYLIELYSNPSDLVIDTFSGSGVVAKACKLKNRKFIATELDEGYYKASILDIQNDLLLSD